MKLSRTRGLNVLAALSAALLVGCGGGSDSDVATFTDTSSFQPQQPVSDWQLVWSDEFSGSQVNTRNWTVLEDDCGGGGNQEKQCYTDNAENVFVQDGNLNIVAMQAEEGASQPYTSARLNSKNKGDFKYGRFEIRAQLPEGQGAWPAIWMMPTDAVYGGWPNSGEIDIVEAVNLKADAGEGATESNIHGTLHYGSVDANDMHSETGKSYSLPGGVNPADDFHTYALEWNEGEMRWYVDDYLYATQRSSDVVTNSKGQAVGLRHQGWYADYYSPATGEMEASYTGAPFDQQFHLIMNLAVGGNWPENVNEMGVDSDAFENGQTLKIDYVRVFECSMNPATGKGCETVRAGYDMVELDHPTGALLVGDAPIPTPPAGPTVENLTIFGGDANPNWAAWNCCGDSEPDLVSDPERGDVYEFEVGETPTVLGFSSRVEVLGEDGTASPFDASAMAESGSLSFDMKVGSPPNNADSKWLIKVESVGAATSAEVALSTSTEAAAPVTGQWQTYTFPLSDLQAAGLDLSAIDVVLIFPAWGTGEGAVYQVDNVEITSPLAASPSLNIFTDEANESWPFWDCCGETTPVVVQDEDPDHGASIEFTVVGETVLGFNARPEFTDAPEQFDASGIMADGVVQFDLKVMTPTADASTAWLMKIESDNAASFAEVNLTTSVEGAAPSSEWQTYTFPVATLVQSGLDASAIDVLMIFPTWGAGDGAIYRVDNVRIYDPTASGGEFNGHVLFKDGELDAWALWDCCGGSTPTVVADDLGHGAVARFEVGADPTVLGMNSRVDIATAPSQIDASSLLTDGVLQFEMKVVTAPTNADSFWLMKIESADAASFAEMNLNTSVEGADPAVGVWQTYTFNLSDLSTAGLDVSAIDVLMVFPAWATGEGAVYLLDNVMIYDPNSLPTRKGITLFENGQTDWAMWDCCGGSTPTVEVDDYDHGTVAEFVVGPDPTVMGFNARLDISANPTNYDASALLADGYLRFEMKVITAPTNADSTWLMKIESDNAATELQVELATSVEGANPAVGVWQTYTFNLSDLSAAGLDVSAIDLVMVFPAWGTGDGAVYRIDNLAISGTLHDSSNDAPDSNYQDEEPSQYMSLIRDEALALIDENNHVEIPDNVNNIFPYAFVNSTIETVSLPSNLNYISYGAFFGTQLTSIEIPNSVTNIAGFAFAYIPTLNTIEIPNYVTDIGFQAFYNTPLDSVIIGKSVINIGEQAFSGVTGNVYIKRSADTVVSIDDFPSDVSIFACDEVEETGDLENCSAAFEGQLRTVLDQAEVINLLDENGHLSIPDNYSSIENEAFKDIDIQSVVIPEFMTKIRDSAFADTPLQTVILHEAIERIGCGTFANTDLSTVIVPTLSVELCGSNSFENVNADFYFINSYIDEHADDHGEDYEHESHGEEFTWGINYFSSGATVYICDALLEGVPVDCQQQFIGEAKSVLDQYAALNLIDENGHAEIPDFYTSIGNSAFSESQLSSIAIPDSIEFIGWSAFADSQLESVIIPNSVTDLGGYAFMNTPLKSVELGVNVCVINEFTFSNTLLEHIKIPECVTFIGNESFYDSTLKQVEFGSNLREISWSAFSNTALTSVTLPNSLVIIGEAAFQNTLLDSVVIPKSVSAIWINAFNTVSEVWFEPYYEEDSYRTYAFNSDTQILFCELDNDLDNRFDCADSDDDNDGMPDSYEIANGFDPFNAGDAQVVNSSNGKTSLQEYLSAANPDTNYPWDNIQGTWRIANEENAISFSQDMFNPIWSIVQGGLPTIDCLLDDRIVFKDDGSYIHLFEEATWVPWLGSMDFFDPNAACLGQNNHAVEGVSHVVGTWRIGNSLLDSSTSLTTSSLSIEKPDTYYSFLTINDNRMQVDIFNGVWWRLQLDRVADQDFDAVDDNQDNCPMIANMGQLDTDNDSQGDSCDQDDDNDGIDDALEIANGFDPLIANMDIDEDGITNSQDTDHDNDGALNEFDAFPLDATEQLDSDNDGIGDNTDVDKDNDGVMNAMDLFPLDAFESADLDGDGIGDNADLFPYAAEYSQDTDQDLIPDAWENKYGLDPLNPNDANLDQDNDGYTALEEFEAGTIPLKILDIDGDGSFDALTDGLIILRFAFGLRGDALVNGVISNEALRTDSAEIEAYLDSLVPSF